MIRYTVLGSGSSGNSYIIMQEHASLIFDAGFSLSDMKRRASQAAIPFDSIQAMFITHMHPDHCRGAGVFSRKTALPVYVHESLVQERRPELESLRISAESLRTFPLGAPVQVGPFTVTAFATSHDSPHSVGYRIAVDGKIFLLLTDTGKVTDEMRELAKQADVLFLEANYERHMLQTGPYPLYLKRRIAGEWGHLSNDDAIGLLHDCKAESDRHRRVYFCHLSKTNNDPSVLAKTCGARLDWDGEITICANNHQYTGEFA
jgi:phosphoribosyl 1,2-cyclic phosphodiesterase